MRKPPREIQVFSVSFLDVLSCALGGVLLLLILVMQSSQREAEAYQEQAKSMQQQMDQALEAMKQAEGDLDAVKRAQSALVGFQGPLKNIVFVFDTSESMAHTGRFGEYLDILAGYVKGLDFEKFNVIEFDDVINQWQQNRLVEASDSNRSRAQDFVRDFKPDGTTNTLGALQAAFANPDVDTIILMSDGAPNQPVEEIHAYLKSANANHQVVINCVAMGPYFEQSYGDFLQKIASDHGGMFIGR